MELLSGYGFSFSETADFNFHALQILAACHDVQDLISRDLGPVERPLASAAVEKREPVCHRVGVMDIVRNENNPDTSISRLGHVFENDGRLMDAERRGWLVKNEETCPKVYRPGNCQTLAFSPRQGPDRLAGISHIDADLR